jgi:branched-chain amino acid transport system ATP-binding protein
VKALLELSSIEAGFGVKRVLHGVDLSVPQGSAVGLFGLNGAGKTVTMKTVVGLLSCWKGTISFDGRDVTRLGPEDRIRAGMAYAPQARQLFPKLTVEQNIRLGGYLLRRSDKRRYTEGVERIYERFPIMADRRSQRAGSLSGGERAMLSIARALASQPSLLLVDEPSAGLAPAVVEDVFRLLRQLRDEGLTLLIVEQNVTFGLRLVERAAVMQAGTVVYEGPVDTLDTARVAKLLGVGRLLGTHLERAVGSRRKPAVRKRTASRRRAR